MSEMACYNCKKDFDVLSRTPRILPSCGHTFCSECLQNWLSSSDQTIVCPEDNIKFVSTHSALGISLFPLNYSLINILRKEEEPFTREGKPRPSALEFIHFCALHKKAADMVCLTDRCVVCVDCVLFDMHKGHSYVRGEDFLEEVKRKIAGFKGKRDQILHDRKLVDNDKRIHALRTKTLEKREELDEAISTVFNDLVARLRQREREVKASAQDKLSKFDSSILFLTNMAQKLRDTERRITTRIQGLSSHANAPLPDFKVFLEEIYGEEPLLERELAELRRSLGELDANCRELVERELEKYSVNASGKALYERIERELDIAYYARPLSEGPAPLADSALIFAAPSSATLLTASGIARVLESDEDKALELLDKFPNITLLDGSGQSTDCKRADAARATGNPTLADPLTPNSRERDISGIRDASLNSLDSAAGSFSADSRDEELIESRSAQRGDPRPPPAPRRLLNAEREARAGEAARRRRYDFSSYRAPPAFSAKSLYYPTSAEGLLVEEAKPAALTSHKASFYGRAAEPPPAHSSGELNEQSNRRKKFLLNPAALASVRHKAKPAVVAEAAGEEQTQLDFCKSNVSDAKLPPIIAEIAKNKQVRTVRLDHNFITAAGFAALIKRLAEHPTLERISLAENCLDEGVLRVLKENVKRLKRLSQFNFRNNKQFKNTLGARRDVVALKKVGLQIELSP